MKKYIFLIAFILLGLAGIAFAETTKPTLPYFNGTSSYKELPATTSCSVKSTGQLTVHVKINPSELTFSNVDGAGGDAYVNFLSKIDTDNGGQREWAFRMYSDNNTVDRANRISFYIFALNGKYSTGAFVQEPVVVDRWLDLVATADGNNIRLYKDAVLKKTNPYDATQLGVGHAPIRIGSGMHANNYQNPSYFNGYIDDFSCYNHALNQNEITALYTNTDNGKTAHWDWQQ